MSCLHELCKEQNAINEIIKDDFELYIKNNVNLSFKALYLNLFFTIFK